MSAERLLATDLDGTFIGDDGAMHALWDALIETGVRIAFSTGRHLQSIESFYAEQGTQRRADACICMVGTDIWRRRSTGYALDTAWHDVIAEEWDRAAIERVVGAVPVARPQADEWQSPFKCSYYLEEDADRWLREIRRQLDAAGVQAKVVYSAGRFLDLLPLRSGKGEAVRYLAAEMDIPASHVVTCGDTGNDLDMMRPELGFRCIAVGNASEELRSFRGAHVYHARASFAGGIREGLEHYGWL